MKKPGRQVKYITLIIAVILLFVNIMPVCYAMASMGPPPMTEISSAKELVAWYNSDDNGETAAAVLTNDIVVDSPIELNTTPGGRDIIANQFTIRIASGGKLTINNPKAVIMCFIMVQNSVITVENGGMLHLKSGVIAGDNSILIKKGGSRVTESGFTITGAIKDENLHPPKEEKIIAGFFDEMQAISCFEKKPPLDSEYTKTALAFVKTPDAVSEVQVELPIEWDISKVDFNAVGKYTALGHFTEEGLKSKEITNPKGLTVPMTISVEKMGEIENAKGELLSIDSKGNAIARLIFPKLSEGITSLHLYKSFDGNNWEKAYWESPDYLGGFVKHYDFKEKAYTVGISTFLSYRFTTEYRSFWLKAEVNGSVFEGITNGVKITIPDGLRPGDGIQLPSDENDGDSGGNRGGGTQGEEEREFKAPPEDKGNSSDSSADSSSDIETQMPVSDNPIEENIKDIDTDTDENTSDTVSGFRAVQKPSPKSDIPLAEIENSDTPLTDSPPNIEAPQTEDATQETAVLPTQDSRKSPTVFYTVIGGTGLGTLATALYLIFIRKP